MNELLSYRKTVIVVLIALCHLGCLNSSQVSNALGKNCQDVTLQSLQSQNSISEECRAAIQGLLPQSQSNFKGRILPLGMDFNASHSPQLYLNGVASDGTILSASDFQNAEITVTMNGASHVLNPSEFTVESLENSDAQVMSIAVVNDYSGSMSDADIDLVSDIESDIFKHFPAIYEAEIFQFSTSVNRRLPFTTQHDQILSSLKRDASYPRESTALYDGMGAGLEDLIHSPRPVRFLIVSTDGLENASKHFVKKQITQVISEKKVPVLILGTLFSDVGELKDLAGSRGIFFYAPGYGALKKSIQAYLQALRKITRIQIDSAYQNASAIQVKAAGMTVQAL